MMICTISTYSHVPRALALAKSIKKHMPQARAVLCLLEKETDGYLRDHSGFDSVILAKDLGIKNFERFIFKYEVNQASFAMKSMLLNHLMNVFPKEKKFIYLDSDIKVYSPLREIEELLNHHSIILTPHILTATEREPQPVTSENMHVSISWRELGAIKTGLFNAGFVALRRNEDTRSFLRWWMYRMERFCICDYKQGINYDQKWLDLVPSLFDTHICRHPGYNMAYWNLSERTLRQSDKGEYSVNEVPLRFFHFSSVGGTLDWMIARCYPGPGDSRLIRSLLKEYSKETERLDKNHYKSMPWSYDFYKNGEKIASKSRRRYKEQQAAFDKRYDHPFLLSNKNFEIKK